MAVKVKLKAIFVAILVAHFDGAVSQETCEQADLKSEYRLSVRDVNTQVLTENGMSDYGVPVIKALSKDADKYTSIIAGETSLQVFLKDIQHYEETTVSEKNAQALRIELVNFDGSCPIQKVDFRIQIDDTNNNDPLFTDENGVSKGTFEVNVPMPLPKNVELQSFGAKIYAKDVDLTNTKVTFSIVPEDGRDNDLDIQYGGVVDKLNKVHSAILKSNAALNYKERTYILTVEDEGTKEEGKRKNTGKLTVKRNEDESVITPKFEKSSYIAIFEDHRLEDLVVIVKDGNGVVPDIVEEEMRDYFKVTVGRTPEEFIVKSGTNWNEKEDAIFTLQINVPSLASPVETVIIVKLENQAETNLPYFEKNFYEAAFNEEMLEPFPVTVKDGTGLWPTIKEAAMQPYFKVTPSRGLADETYNVESVDGHPWKEKKDAIFTLEIDGPGLAPPVETVIIVKLENEAEKNMPYFEKTFYESAFKEEMLEPFPVTVKDGIGLIPTIKEAAMQPYFKVTPSRGLADETYNVQSVDGHPWKEKKDAIFTLEIDGPGLAPPVETVIIVKLENEAEKNMPHFEKTFYESAFKEEMLEALPVTVKDGIGLMPTIKEAAMQPYFKVTPSRGLADETYNVESVVGHPWKEEKDAIFTLEIDGSGLASPVETVIIVKKEKLTQPKPPTFKELHYTGNVNKNGELSFKENITLLGDGQGDVRFEDSDMDKIFTVKNTNGLVTITKIGVIQPDVEEILLIVIAKHEDLEGSTAVLIKIEGGSATKFDKPFYEGVYDGTKLNVDTITLANYQSGNVVLDPTYDKFFKTKFDNGVVTITTSDDFEQLKEACVSLALQLKDSNVAVASTSVFLTISKLSGDGPKFDRCFYKAVYDGVQLYSDFIQVENPDDVEVELSDPTQENLVKVSSANGRVVLVKQPDLDGYAGPQLLVQIKITSKQRDISEKEAVLILTINKRGDNSPYFKNPYQLVKYQPSISLIATVDVTNGKYGNVKLVEQEYGEYVEAILADTKLVVMKKKDLFELDVATLGLTFLLTDKSETLAGLSVLFIAIDKEEEEETTSSTTAATPPPTNDDDTGGTDTGGLIAGIVVLACLLVLFMLGAIAFWYFKLRNKSPAFGNLAEDRIFEVDDNQNFSNRDVKFDDSALSNPSFVDNPKRRNTGYVFNPPPPESDDDASSVEEAKPKAEDDKADGPVASQDDTDKPQPRLFERRKSVTFDDNVEKIQIEKSQDGDDAGKTDAEPAAEAASDV